MSKHPNVPVLFPICSSCLSISHLKLFGSWQFIGFSSPGQGWAIIRPHQAWRSNHSWALFFSHGVFSQWQAHWLRVGSGCVRLPASAVELLRGVCKIETGAEADWELDTSGSFICDGNQAVYHTSPTTLSARTMLRDIPEDCHIVRKASPTPGPTDGSFLVDTHWSIIASSERYTTLQLRFIAPHICSIMMIAEKMHTGCLIIWPVNAWDAEIHSVTYSISVAIFPIQVHLLFPDNCYHMKAILFIHITCSRSRKKLRPDNRFACAYIYAVYVPKENKNTSPLLFELLGLEDTYRSK